jgi:hypothetical protein
LKKRFFEIHQSLYQKKQPAAKIEAVSERAIAPLCRAWRRDCAQKEKGRQGDGLPSACAISG